MIEFGEQDSAIFDEVMDILKRHPDFDYQQLNKDSVLSIPGLEIYPNRRKIYRGRKEISLTVKEYDLFYLLVVNQGHVLTYNQIYQKIWGEDALGNESNTDYYHSWEPWFSFLRAMGICCILKLESHHYI